VVLAVLVVGAVLFVRAPHQAFLRFPVTAFVPLAFLLAYIRSEAYRVGYADSLSRMWIHIVPIAVLYVVAALAGSQLGQPRQLPAQAVAGADAGGADPADTPSAGIAESDTAESRS
jgi:hypothetical protein